MKEVRCGRCGRKLAEASFIELQIKCPRCGAFNHLKAESLLSAPKSAILEVCHGKTHSRLDGR